MDVVYPYRKSRWCELKYSLRSLKHIDCDNVYIIGELPEYINERKVKFIPQEKKRGRNTYDVVEKLLTMCDVDELSEDFILMNDDFYFLCDQKIEQLDFGLLSDHISRRKNDGYKKTLKITYQKLREWFPPIKIKSYEVHYPIILNKKKFKKVFSNGYHKDNVVWRSIYGNKIGIDSKTVEEDFKFRKYNELEDKKNKRLLSSPPRIKRKLEEVLRSKLPKKSIYEVEK